jgi:hypothetical protein
MAKTLSDRQIVDNQWKRYMTGMERGHWNYQRQARQNEDYYFGAGRQWDDDIKAALEAEGKPWLEANMIFSTINTIVGYQTQSRMDMTYKPRENADQETADSLTKVAMYVVDENKYPWIESSVFEDGLIQQRGYFDIRIDFDKNMAGNIKITDLDPMDVIPDPDAKSYDPDNWLDVTVTRWITMDDVKTLYGLAKWREVYGYTQADPDFGAEGYGVTRNKFGDRNTYMAYYRDEYENNHVRVIERQWWKLTNRKFFFDVITGDYFPVPDTMKPREVKRYAKTKGYEIVSRVVKRVRWTVSTRDVLLHDDWSPYDHFTIVPYFPYFRRGKTVGIVDNMIKQQEMVNKTMSQILHIVNTTANSGWMVEQNSLTNMDVEDLEEDGSKTGLVLEYKPGRAPPAKIEPNQVPTGLKDLVTTGVELMRMISGVSETFQGGKGPEVTGVAIQSRVHQNAVQLAAPIDNLFRTRNILAQRILELIQAFYTDERVFIITSDSPAKEAEQVVLNQQMPDGSIINDVTLGKYDIVIADVPTQVTFQNAQFQQALELRKYGIMIPDDEMVLMSTLARKNDIAKRLAGEVTPEQQAMQKKMAELQGLQLDAQADKLESDARARDLEGLKAAAEVANLMATNPAIASYMDEILSRAKQIQEESEQEDKMEMQPEGLGQQPTAPGSEIPA